jgi:hypothetical protein
MIDEQTKLEIYTVLTELAISVRLDEVKVTEGVDLTTDHAMVWWQFTNTVDPSMSWEFTLRKKLTPP